MNVPLLIRSFDPLPRLLSLHLPAHTTVSQILQGFTLGLSSSSTIRFSLYHNGLPLTSCTRLSHLPQPLTLEVRVPLLGGKGGFGSMLRAQGGKMSSKGKNFNNDSCRDLNGRRLSTMKEAKKLADYLQGQEERQKNMDEARKKKYQKLEKMLGRKPRIEKGVQEAAERMQEVGQGFESLEAGDSRPEQTAGTKRKERMEDSEYMEQSREIVENVRSAVASAMKKKKMVASKAKATA